MAKLSKDIYDKKANWASERMERNKEIKSLTVNQHDALSTIASKRHNLHVSSGGNPSRYDSEGYYNFFGSTFLDGKGKLIEIIEENNLPKFKPYLIIDEFTYLGGDEWNDDEIDGYDENLDLGSEDYDKKYDAYLNIILNNIELLDQSVRDYLAYIDYLYGTNYAPSRGDYYKYIEKDIKMAKGGNIKKTTDGKKGGILYGKSHAQGGIKAVVTDAGNKEVELEGGEAVVKKSALKDKTVKTLTGTNAQILNLINTRAGGNPIYAPSEVKMKNGGRVGSDDFSDIESLISKGIVEIEYEKSTEKHAKEYGLQCKKPLYLKRIYVRKDYRLKGVGKRVLKYLDFIAQKNSNDCIFGYVSNKVIFTKDNRDVNYNDVQLFKFWLHENGYAINDDNNDFHKVISLKMAKGGRIEFKGSRISDKTINEETDFIAEYLEDNGFFILRGARSRTDFGESNYLYAHNKVDEVGFPMGDGVKIRISDHSVSNFDRIFNEIHVRITDTKESWEKSAFSVLMKLQWQYDKNNKFRKEDAVEIKKVTIEIHESQLRINPPYADKILSERISNNGKKLLTVERTLSNSIEKWYHKESGTYYTTIKPNVFDKGGSIDNKDNIKNKWKSVGKMAKGGSIEDNCISFIKNSEAIKNNGYFHYFKNISIYADFGTKVPKTKSFYLCAYNSGGQKNLKVTDTLNLDLINKLQEIIDCEKSICRIIVDEFFRKAKRIESNDLSRMTGENIIVVDRYNIVCDNIKNEFSSGGSITPSAINNMTKAEQKAFYKTKEGKELDKQTYSKWKSLVNMSKGELESFYNSKEGKEAGLSASEAKAEGIDSGRESARWIMKMKDIPYTEWTSNMWVWAKKQISFVSRMKGMRGDLYDDKGNKTRKHLALLIWGHNPKKMAEGGVIPQQGTLFTKDKKNKLDYKKVGNDYVFKVYDVESNPVENYTRHQCKKRNNNEATMDYNQFINYLYSEHYIDDKKMAEGGNVWDSKLLAPNGKPSNLTAEQYKLVRTAAFKKWFGDWENDAENASKVVDENGEPMVLYHGTDVNFNVYDLSKIGEGSDLLGKGIYLTEKKDVANFYANLVAKKRYIKGYEAGIFGTQNAIYEEDADKKAEKHKLIYEFFVNAKNIKNINQININNDLKQILIKSISFMFGNKSEDVINSRIDFADKNHNQIRNYRGKIIYLIEQFPDAKKEILEYIKNKYDCIFFEPTIEFESNYKDYKNYVVFNSNQIKLADGTNTTFDGSNADIRFAEGGVTGDVFSIKDPEQFKQLITLYNKFSEKFDVDNYFVDDSSVVFLRKVKFTNAELKGMAQYIADLSKNQNFSIISDKKPEISNGYFKFFLNERVRYKEGGNTEDEVITYRNKFNKKYGFELNESHSLQQIAKLTGLKLSALQDIYNKGIGAYKTNPSSVRPNVKSKEQWAMARVYSAVMGGKASKVDENELERGNMAEGGSVGETTFTDYKGEQIMYEPHNREYFVIGNDENIFKSMEDAKAFIDNPNGAINTEYAKMAAAETNEVVKNEAKREGLQKVVLDEGNGIIINDLFNEWNNIKNEKQSAQWKDKIKNTKFGTYGTVGLMETIKRFNPKLNDTVKRMFYTEIEAALGIDKKQRTYKPYVFERPSLKETPQVGNVGNMAAAETKELQKGIKVEQEHEKTFKKVAKGKISVKDAIKETAEEHIAENPNYYDELEKIEGGNKNKEVSNNALVDKIKQYNGLNLNIKKSKKGSEIFLQIIKLSANQDVSIKQDSKNYKIKAIQGNGKKLTLKGSNTKAKDYNISDDDFDFAKQLISSGVLGSGEYDKNGEYFDSYLTVSEVKKGIKDIRNCKKSIPARRLIDELKKQYDNGFFQYKKGSGFNIIKETVPVNLVDVEPISPYESCDNSFFNDEKKLSQKDIIDEAIDDLVKLLNIVPEGSEEENTIRQNIKDLHELKQII